MKSTNTRRLGALALVAAFAIGACGPAASTANPSVDAPSTAPEGSAPASGTPTALLPACLSFADIYSVVGPESTGFDNWMDGQEIATALGSTTTFPDAPLSITAPGEESGTFDSFVELVLEGPAEERTIPEDQCTTRPDYTSSSNDNAIVDGVSGSAGSLGWVGFAFFEENLDTLRAFEIAEEAGGTCVAASAETIASNEYPIARDLFIYVNKAKAAANPAVVAYVDYYLADGTIDTVLETVPYVPLGDALAESKAPGRPARPAPRRPERHDLRDWFVHRRADLERRGGSLQGRQCRLRLHGRRARHR